jgi:vitamin B12 transporter
VSVNRTFRFRRWSATLNAAVRNLTDCRYEVIRYYPMPGRSVELTATFGL